LTATLLRLPPGSRLRRVLLVRAIRDSMEAFARRDYDALLIPLDPKIVMHTADAFPETTVFRGRDGVRCFLSMIDEVWIDYRIEPEMIVDLGDRYVMVARHRARGRHSGLEVDQRISQLATFHDGMIDRVDYFDGPIERVLEAAGLSE
jgi:ketosteroid isomerase-like protein